MAMDMSRKEEARRRNWKMAVFGLQLLMKETQIVLGEAETADGMDGVGVRPFGPGTGFTRTSTPIGIVIDIDMRPPRSAAEEDGWDIGVAQIMIPARSPPTSTSQPRRMSLEEATAHGGGQCVCEVVLPARLRMDTHRRPARALSSTARARTATAPLHQPPFARPTCPCTLVVVVFAPLVT